MTDHVIAHLRRDLARVFGGARQIAVLALRQGRLSVVGEPTGAQIASAAMLLASVNIRLPSNHTYLASSVPAAAMLREVQQSDRGAILVAPVLDTAVPVGLVLIEGHRGRLFTPRDLACLEAMTELTGGMPRHA